MFGFRTPLKSGKPAEDAEHVSAKTQADAGSLAPSSVRRSVGEWESGKPAARLSLTPPKNDSTGGPSRPKPAAVRRLSAEAAKSPPKPTSSKASPIVAEARACLCKAKMHLANSRNLKTDIKVGVLDAVDRLFQLVKEADSSRDKPHFKEPECKKDTGNVGKSSASCTELERMLVEHLTLIKENTKKMGILTETLEKRNHTEGPSKTQNEAIGEILSEVRDLRQATDDTSKKITSLQEAVPSYAEVLARPVSNVTSPLRPRPKHSVIVSSDNDLDTSEDVLGKVREALEAKTNGLQVTKVQKVRNQKVVLSCATKEELEKVRDRITTKNKNLNVEEAKNKDPLIIIKNLLTFNKDDDIVASLRTQNASLLACIPDEDFRAVVKYRRKARNPHENHVVLQTSPKVWQKLTQAKRIHIDLQYVVVQDQSPLVQCTRCLGYGHGRRFCKEPADLCSYCAGPHLRADCADYLTGITPTCRNCRSEKSQDTGHNAFDGDCPIRRKWDAIARSSVAYC